MPMGERNVSFLLRSALASVCPVHIINQSHPDPVQHLKVKYVEEKTPISMEIPLYSLVFVQFVEAGHYWLVNDDKETDTHVNTHCNNIPSEISGIYLASRYFYKITLHQGSNKSDICANCYHHKRHLPGNQGLHYAKRNIRETVLPVDDSSHDKL
jgi:hypothetical protein